MITTAQGDDRRRRRRWIKIGFAILALLVVLPLWVIGATDPTENIALSRNEVVRAQSGARNWHGTFWNHSDSLYTNLDAVILFLDKDGKPVGQARGGAARLDPGEIFELQSPLPREAMRMQVYQLRWTNDGHNAVLGPYHPWAFGYVMDSQCGKVRLAIGACTPARRID